MKLLIMLFVLPIISWGQTSYVPATKLLKKGGYELFLGGDGFMSSRKISPKGKNESFQNSESFVRYQGEAGGSYGLTSDFQASLGLRFRQNQSTVYDPLTRQNNDLSSDGIQSTFFTLKYAFRPVGLLSYSLEGTFRLVPYTNQEGSTTADGDFVLGDEGNEYSGGGAVTYSMTNNNFLTARIGARKPGQDLSPELYWQIEGSMAWRRFALVAGVDGVSSMNRDPHSGEEADHPKFNTGASRLYNSVNREWITPYAGFNVAIGKTWRVETRASQVVSGRSTDLGTGFSVYLIHRADKEDKISPDKKFKSYDIEATITKVSPKKGYVMIDKGLSSDIKKGMKFDFFEFDYLGGNVLVASGSVLEVKADTSIVKLTQRYNSKKEVKEGLIGRATAR